MKLAAEQIEKLFRVLFLVLLTVVAFFAGLMYERSSIAEDVTENVQDTREQEQVLNAESIAITVEHQEALAKTKELESKMGELAKQLRIARLEKLKLMGGGDGKNSDDGTDACSRDDVYRVFNAGADHPDLPENEHRQEPDGARDGLDAVQYCVGERQRLAVKVVSLQEVIKASACIDVIE